MLKVVFKNVESSSATRKVIQERFDRWINKFPDLIDHSVTVTAERLNSRTQPGPDLFLARVLITGEKFKDLCLQKESPDLYAALAQIDEGILELLNRAGDKARVRSRATARRLGREGGVLQ
jgi:ribosome-associated translation inhibitor RaiA